VSIGALRVLAAATLAMALTLPQAALAQDAGETDQRPDAIAEDPGYREYSPFATTPALDYKSAEQIEQEEALAEANAIACDSFELDACHALGVAYEFGRGVPQNRPVAAELYYQACIGHFAQGCTALGNLYLAGLDRDAQADGLIALEQGCALGSLDACRELGHAIGQGLGTEPDKLTGEAIMRTTCEAGDAEACLTLSAYQTAPERDFNDQVEAVRRLETLCREGNVRACANGSYYSRFSNYPDDYRRAIFLHYGCVAEDVQSCVGMGEAAFRGEGVPADRESSLAYFDRACAIDDRYCQFSEAMRAETDNLYDCEAFEMDACLRLAQAYAISSTPISDFAKAEHYFVRACEEGNIAEACREAALSLRQGTQDLELPNIQYGNALLVRACDGGDSLACRTFADELERGVAFDQDLPRAIALYEQECAREDEVSCAAIQRLAGSNPEIELSEAGENFLPPIEFDENGIPSNDWVPAEIRNSLTPNCIQSSVEFRGRTFSDRICRNKELALGSYRMRPGQAPWQALLWRPSRIGSVNVGRAQRVHCGGSVIARGWILTAAHCLVDQGRRIQGQDYRVRLGVYNPRKEEGVSYPILSVHPHPKYVRRTYAYDIALIRYDADQGRVEGPTNSIARIRLDRQSMAERRIAKGMNVYSYGWGWTELENSSSSDYLQGVKLQLENPDDCTRITGFRGRDEGAAICAAGQNGAQTCFGDSGGPLITYGDRGRIPTVIAVVSWGRKCGTTGTASAFTRVAKVSDWIERTLRENRRRR